MRIDRKSARAAMLSAAVVAALSSSSAHAVDTFWDGTAGNNFWSHGPNWFGVVPTTGDDAKFDAASSVVRNVVVIDGFSVASNIFIDGVPPPGNYEFQSLSNAQLFVANDLTIAGIAANPTPVTFNNLNLDTGRLVLGANGTLTLTGVTNHLHAANGMQIFGRLNWQSGTITTPFSTIAINSGGSVDVTAGGRGLGPDVTLAITNGQFTSNSYFDIGSSLDAGNGPVGSLSVSGSSASYVQTGGPNPIWGYNASDHATVTFTDQATGTLASGVDIGGNGGGALVSVMDGAKLHVADHMNVGVVSMRRSNDGRPIFSTNPGQQLNAGLTSVPVLVSIDGGTLTVAGTAHVGAGGAVQLVAGRLELNGDATFSTGSTFNWSGGAWNNAPGTTLAFEGGAGSFTVPGGGVAGGHGLSDGSTLRIAGGGSLVTNSFFDIASSFGGASSGTMIVTGPGSSFTSTALPGGSNASYWSDVSGQSATVTFSNFGAGSYNAGVIIGESGGAGTVNIQSSARLNTASLLTGTAGGTSDGIQINVSGGTLNSVGPAVLRQGTVVNYSAGSFSAGTVHMSGNARINLTTGGNKVLRVGGLSMSNTSKIDLNDNDMIVGALTSRATVTNLVRTARNGGTWDGPAGITSTAAKNATPNRNTTLGILSGAEYSSVGGTGLFSGQPYVPADTLVKYTWYGDTDFNGQVNFDDYGRVDFGFNNNLTGWLNGDLDYSGSVNFDDYGLIDLAFNTQGGTLLRATQFLDGSDRSMNGMTGDSLGMVVQHFNEFGQSYANSFLTAVPEPSAIALLAPIGAMLARRRRKS